VPRSPCSRSSPAAPVSAPTAPGRRAEQIGARVAHELLEDIAAGATIDRHASDQIIPFAALAEGTSTFQVPLLTEHAETAGWLASALLGAEVSTGQQTLAVRGQSAQHRTGRGSAGRSPAASRDAGRPASAG